MRPSKLAFGRRRPLDPTVLVALNAGGCSCPAPATVVDPRWTTVVVVARSQVFAAVVGAVRAASVASAAVALSVMLAGVVPRSRCMSAT